MSEPKGKGALKARPSLSHLADKFNTAPPPGYVAGRGRGVSGFSQPTKEDLRAAGRGRGRGDGDGGGGRSAAGSSADGTAGPLKPGAALEGESGDTRALDLGAGAGVSTQLLWANGFHEIVAVDPSRVAWDSCVTLVQSLVQSVHDPGRMIR